ncbi:MAG: hypothetical protein ABR508_01660 [Candidatus Baltobacteraceae bacterium]
MIFFAAVFALAADFFDATFAFTAAFFVAVVVLTVVFAAVIFAAGAAMAVPVRRNADATMDARIFFK